LLAVFGLGNPRKKYQDTRHNIGFIVLDYVALNAGIPFKYGKGDYYFAEMTIKDESVILIKPTTFMNLSGIAVGQVCSDYQLSHDDVLVVYDDFQLPFGTIRFRKSGSDGGHKGIKSIIGTLGTTAVNRLRIGIGDPLSGAVDYVLSAFNRVEQKVLTDLLPIISDGIMCWVGDGIAKAMNLYNRSHKDITIYLKE
jgi:PTH1 family peptidyl-tRNA hydrolase